MEGRFYTDPQSYNNILVRCKRKNIKYDDNDFKPCDDNIIDPNDEVDDLQDLGQVNWLSASKIESILDKYG